MAQDRITGVHSGSAWGARLGRVLDALHDRYTALHGLCERQAALVEQDDPWPLLGLLGERQTVIDEIGRLSRELESLRGERELHRVSLPEGLREHIRRRSDQIAELAAAVATRDGADRVRLTRRRDEIAERLVQVGRARGAVAAYGRGGPMGPAFQDTEA